MNTKKNKDEFRAKKYLQTLQYSQVEYEPLGNVTPDFLLDKKIAVEVRRLNRNHIDGNNLLSVENLQIPLIKNIKKIIATFRYSSHTNSAYVSITLCKPLNIQNQKSIIRKVKKTFKKHTQNITHARTYTIGKYLDITFTPTDKKSNIYIYAGCNGDSDWLIHEMHKNIQSVIDEKNKKIEKNFTLYNEWWLLLVDSILYGFDEKDFEALKKIQLQKHRFSKVIILSPKGGFNTFEF